MNAASEDVKDMLEDPSSLGLIFDTNLFIGKESSETDAIVVVRDSSGFAPERTLSNIQDYFYSSFQVLVRDIDYPTGITLARDIMNYLHGRAGETWNGTLYTVIQATGEPSPMGFDKNNRVRFIINFNCQRR